MSSYDVASRETQKWHMRRPGIFFCILFQYTILYIYAIEYLTILYIVFSNTQTKYYLKYRDRYHNNKYIYQTSLRIAVKTQTLFHVS